MCSASKFINFFTVFVCAALFGAGLAEAAYIEWEGGGVGNRDGVFGDANNWNTGQVPGTNDYARFLINEAYTVSLDAPVTNNVVHVYDGVVTFNLGGHAWVMETTPNEKARFHVQGDEASKPVAILTNGYLWCKEEICPALFSNKYGTVIFRGADATFSSVYALVGSRGDGTLRLEQGATGTVRTLRLGELGGDGCLDVRDPGSHIYVTQNMEGDKCSGSGRVAISNEGAASFSSFYMGRGSILLDNGTLDITWDMHLGYTNAEGNVSVIMRNGAILNATRNGRFGYEGSSNVTGRIESGSRLTTKTASIGLHPGSADLTVTGAGSMLEAPVGLHVADSNGFGRLTVAAGGRVVAGGEMRIARANTNAVGEIIITGPGSEIVLGSAAANDVLLAGNQYPPVHGSYIKGGQALLALRDGGRLTASDNTNRYLDIRVQEAGTVELDGGFLKIRRFRFFPPDGVIATNVGTLRVILHPEQANADEPMATITGANELNGARLELGLAPGFKPQLNNTFKVIGGTATAPPLGAFTWQGEEIADGDVLMLGKYGFRADINGNNFTLTTTIVPPSGTVFSIR